MPNPPPTSFDKWRDYFRSINADIFSIIEHAIMVASKDYPYDFKLKRDRIAEVLFACKVTKCIGCDKIELALPKLDDHGDDDGLKESAGKKSISVNASETKKTVEERKNCNKSRDKDRHTEAGVMKNHASMFSYGDAEALTDEIEEESQFFSEVLRIKGIIDKAEEMSDDELIDSLKRLELMPLSVETLKATKIGKSVNCLRGHRSKEIRSVSKKLIADWKTMVDEWVSSTQAITGAELASAHKTPSVHAKDDEEDEGGLPSPPLDEGAFFATPSSMEFSQFFDGMDDDISEFEKNIEGERVQARGKAEIRTRKNDSSDSSFARARDKKPPALKKQVATSSSKLNGDVRTKPIQKPVAMAPPPPQREKVNYDNEASVQDKLEVAKRKLQERYQEAEKAKKQRTIQVVEIHDLPKQSLGQRNNQSTRNNNGGNFNRFRTNWRR